jgi:uncharacterized FlaG/YvyC family protein
MNGAELPCGAILQVQPADSTYSNSQQQLSAHGAQQNQETNQRSSHEQPMTSDDKVEGKQDDIEDDLDDFFGSLE